jgi:hypothetical protein
VIDAGDLIDTIPIQVDAREVQRINIRSTMRRKQDHEWLLSLDDRERGRKRRRREMEEDRIDTDSDDDMSKASIGDQDGYSGTIDGTPPLATEPARSAPWLRWQC